MEIEGPFVKVPCEIVSQVFRKTQKLVTRELTSATKTAADLADRGDEEARRAALTAVAAKAEVDAALQRLRSLKEDVMRADGEEKQYLARIQARLDHLNQAQAAPRKAGTSASSLEAADAWEERRLDRWIAEYMLRCGYFEVARELTAEAGIEDFVDVEVFVRAAEVEASLRRRECGAALAWCADNASRLRRLESALEFDIRRQMFVEMVRSGNKDEAIQFAQEHLAKHAAERGADVQQAMATLAFPQPAACPIPEYAALFAPERWDDLLRLFGQEVLRVFGLTQPSVLELTLQAGLSALKTPLCYRDDPSGSGGSDDRGQALPQQSLSQQSAVAENQHRSLHCPVCSDAGRELARGLPCSHRGQSTLICRVTGDKMDENNPPVALPNGHVYSTRAIREGAHAHCGVFTCPVTGQSFDTTLPASVAAAGRGSRGSGGGGSGGGGNGGEGGLRNVYII